MSARDARGMSLEDALRMLRFHNQQENPEIDPEMTGMLGSMNLGRARPTADRPLESSASRDPAARPLTLEDPPRPPSPPPMPPTPPRLAQRPRRSTRRYDNAGRHDEEDDDDGEYTPQSRRGNNRGRGRGRGAGNRRQRNHEDVANLYDEAQEREEARAEEAVVAEPTCWVQSEQDERSEAILGVPNPDRSKCFGCAVGTAHSPHISMQAYIELINMYRKEKLTTDAIVLALKMERHVRRKIIGPANELAAKTGRRPYPPWLAKDIKFHFERDLKEASNVCHENLLKIEALKHTILDNDIYFLKDDGRGKRVRSVDMEGIKKLDIVLRLERAARNTKLAQQVWYSPDYALVSGESLSLINLAGREFYLPNMPDRMAELTSSKHK